MARRMVKEMYGYDINHDEVDNDLVSNIPCNVPLLETSIRIHQRKSLY